MDNEYKEAIGREQLRLVMQQVPAMQAAALVVAFFLSYAVWGIVSGANILAFVLPVSAVAASRVVLYMRFLKVRNEPFVAGNWRSAYLRLALISGIVWGSSAFLILPRGNPWILALFVLVLASMSASTTVSHSSVKWGPTAWIVPAMLPYAVRCLMDGGEQESILACLIVLYVIVMLLYSHKHHLSITSSIALRFENMKLVEYVRESETRYRGLYEKTPAMLHSIDRTGRILYVSDQWLATLGYAREEVLGRRSVEFLTEESRRYATETVLPEFMRTGQCKDVEYRIVKKNGEVIETLLSATSEGDAEGNVVRSLAVIVDITDRKRMEERLRRSENRFATVFRASPVCISLSRFSDGDFLDINDAFLRLFGYDREEVVGSNSLMLNIWANPDDRARMVETLRKSGRSDGFETTFRTKSGEIRNMIIISEVVDVGGEQYILGLSHDITDRKRAEQEKDKLQDQLLQAMKMEAVGRLAGGVAHDFNNLMTVIMGYSELMLQKIGKDSPLHGQVEEIKRAGERAASLTQQLLAFSRKQIIQPKVLDLNILITDLSKMLPRLIGEDIEIQVTTGKALGAVKIDPGQFQQILMNLAVNARDAMPKGGKLLIETANVDLDEGYCGLHPYVTPGRYVMLSVSDTGTGMSDEVKLHIFEPFFTTKPK
ncbi:MAG: PAS sensor histidine kinase [Actinobacteria bacterium]|nr:PAS sensor histidine kinase [Actinomycetota bacterium]